MLMQPFSPGKNITEDRWDAAFPQIPVANCTCGLEPTVTVDRVSHKQPQVYVVKCVCGRASASPESRNVAIELWNKATCPRI